LKIKVSNVRQDKGQSNTCPFFFWKEINVMTDIYETQTLVVLSLLDYVLGTDRLLEEQDMIDMLDNMFGL
jgi:hypothetical protein